MFRCKGDTHSTAIRGPWDRPGAPEHFPLDGGERHTHPTNPTPHSTGVPAHDSHHAVRGGGGGRDFNEEVGVAYEVGVEFQQTPSLVDEGRECYAP